MLNDWSHKVRAILKEYCPGNIKKLLPSLSQSGNTRFYFGHQKLCMDNNYLYFVLLFLFLPYGKELYHVNNSCLFHLSRRVSNKYRLEAERTVFGFVS